MKVERSLARKIFLDALLSILLYALPVLLMLLSFYISGERPWKNKATPTSEQKSN